MALQDHIHLDTTLDNGPEYAPVKKWKATKRTPVPQIYLSAERALTGQLQVQVLSSGGSPLQFLNYEYTLLLHDLADLSTLLGQHGKLVSFVDHDHPNDGSSHATYVQSMLLRVTEIRNLDPWFQHIEVDITVVDNETV